MRSPTYALLWEMWRRHRATIAVIVGLTIAGRLLDFSERGIGADGSSGDSSSLVELLWMFSFGLLFGIFNYTDSGGTRGLGRFPHRLFTLPVSSLRLVALPVLTGIASVELLYLLWMGPLSKGGSTSPPFVAVLLGALMVFYQAVLWTLERLGPLRLVVVGAVDVSGRAPGRHAAVLSAVRAGRPPPCRSGPQHSHRIARLAVAHFADVGEPQCVLSGQKAWPMKGGIRLA